MATSRRRMMASIHPSLDEIEPNIFLGNAKSSTSLTTLLEYQISAMVSLGMGHFGKWRLLSHRAHVPEERHLFIPALDSSTQDLLQHMTEACEFIERMRSSSVERPASFLFTDAEGRTSETVAFENFLKNIDFGEQIRLALVGRSELPMYAGEQASETLANAKADTSKNVNHIEHLPLSEQEAEQTLETITTRETMAASEADTSPNANRIEHLPLGEQEAQLFSIPTDTDEQTPETTATPEMTTSETATLEAHTSNNVILVHCDVGVSRSATIMIGYLMRKHCIPLSDALAMVKEKRRIKPSSNFIEQLKVWEDTGYEVYEDVETKAPKLQYQEYLGRRAERLKEKGINGQ